MAEQTIALEAGWYSSGGGSPNRWIRWEVLGSDRPSVDAGLRGAENRYFASLFVYEAGRIVLRFAFPQSEASSSANDDLSDLFESSGSTEIVSGSDSVVVPMAGVDTSEPYDFTPSNFADVIAFWTAMSARTGNQAGSLIIRDFTLAAPAFADDTGDAINGTVGTAIADVVVPEATGSPAPTYAVEGTLPTGVAFAADTRTLSFDESAIEAGSGTITIRATNSEGTADWTVAYTFLARGAFSLAYFSATGTVHMLLRVTSGNYARSNGQENLWASDSWQSGTPAEHVGTIEEGDAGITDAITLTRLARWDNTGTDNRLILNSVGNISDLFDQAEDVYRLTVVRETSTGYEIITVGPPSGEPSDRTFTDWRLNDGTLSQAEWDFLDAIADGDELILAVHEGTASYSPPADHAVDGGDVTFEFAIPQPTVTHTPRAAMTHEVDGGDATFLFQIPQPTVTHVPRPAMTHAVDGDDATFEFQLPQPTVTHVPRPAMQHAVDGGDAAFNFLLPQPTVTHVPAGPQTYAVNGGDATFEFQLPQPTVTHTPRPAVDHAVDGGDATFTFLIPEPSVLHGQQHAVDGGGATFEFALPQPTVTRRVAGGRDAGDITWMFDISQPRVTHRPRVLSLLPPGKTPLEIALEYATAPRVSPDAIRDLWNPWKIPAPLLPWLAWALSVDHWEDDWTERQKRAVIAASIEIHRHKGTPWAMRRTVEALGWSFDMIEWWETTPTGTPGTADVYVARDETTTQAQVNLLRPLLDEAKRATLHVTLNLLETFPATVYAYGLLQVEHTQALVLEAQPRTFPARFSKFAHLAVWRHETLELTSTQIG